MIHQTPKHQIQTKTSQIKSSSDSVQQTFLDHLLELRTRLFFVAVAFVGGGSLGYVFKDNIAAFLLEPLKGQKLIYLSPGGGLDFVFKICFNVGLTAAIPVIVYQLYRYLAPVIKVQKTRRLATTVTILSAILATVGILFGYFIILPSSLSFLINFADKYVQANLTATSYMDFVISHSLGVAAVFQLPIVLLFINTTFGPIKPIKLLQTQPYIFLGSIIFAGIIAPPDLLSQAIVALPVFAIYQIGVMTVLVQNRRQVHKSAMSVNYAPTTSSIAIPTKLASVDDPSHLIEPTIQPTAKVEAVETAATVSGVGNRTRVGMDFAPTRSAVRVPTRSIAPTTSPSTTRPTVFASPAKRRTNLIDGMFVLAR